MGPLEPLSVNPVLFLTCCVASAESLNLPELQAPLLRDKDEGSPPCVSPQVAWGWEAVAGVLVAATGLMPTSRLLLLTSDAEDTGPLRGSLGGWWVQVVSEAARGAWWGWWGAALGTGVRAGFGACWGAGGALT